MRTAICGQVLLFILVSPTLVLSDEVPSAARDAINSSMRAAVELMTGNGSSTIDSLFAHYSDDFLSVSDIGNVTRGVTDSRKEFEKAFEGVIKARKSGRSFDMVYRVEHAKMLDANTALFVILTHQYITYQGKTTKHSNVETYTLRREENAWQIVLETSVGKKSDSPKMEGGTSGGSTNSKSVKTDAFNVDVSKLSDPELRSLRKFLVAEIQDVEERLALARKRSSLPDNDGLSAISIGSYEGYRIRTQALYERVVAESKKRALAD